MKEAANVWVTYHEQTKERPPRPSLVRALEFVAEKDDALDLGAGSLNDTKFLLQSGFKHVVALDQEPTIEQRASEVADERLDVVVATFHTFEFPEESYNLVNAQYSLPFETSEALDHVFEAIKSSLKEGGYLRR